MPVRLSVTSSLCVCMQNISKSYEKILQGGAWSKNQSDFGSDLDYIPDPEFLDLDLNLDPGIFFWKDSVFTILFLYTAKNRT